MANKIMGLIFVAIAIAMIAITVNQLWMAQVRVDEAQKEVELARQEVRQQLEGLDTTMEEINQQYG